MKINSYKKFLEEVELNLSTLAKDINSEKRGNVLVNKLKNKETLTNNNNQPVVVDKMKSGEEWVEPEEGIESITDDDGLYDIDKANNYFTTPSRRYIDVFIDEDGEKFPLNKLKKTQDFGSKGAGVKIKQFESLQAIFLAIKQALPEENLNANNFRRFYNYYVEDAKLGTCLYLPENIKINSELIENFLEDKDWIKTFCKIPNKLYRDNLLDKNMVYDIFHASYVGSKSPYYHIDKKYKEFAKEEGFTDINISKYSPADIYLSFCIETDEINKQIDNCRNINDLTDKLNSLFDEKKLIGISLKKVVESFKIITNWEIGKEAPEFFITQFKVGSDLRGIGSKISTTSIWKHRDGKDVDIKDRLINFDSPDTSKPANVDGEVEGSASRHGRISLNRILSIFNSVSQKFKTQRIQSYDELKSLNIEELRSLVKKLISKCKEMRSSLSGDIVSVQPVVRGTDISNNEKKLISRVQSLQIVFAFMQIFRQDEKTANLLMTKIMRYALSIETDQFKTPRYYRII